VLHYDRLRYGADRSEDYSAEGNIEFLKGMARFSKVQPAGVREIKTAFSEAGIACRPVAQASAHA
jgi:hypothetical protein